MTLGKLPIDVLSAFLSVESEAQLLACVERYARQLGFDHFVYGVQVVQPLADPRQHICNGYPERWRRRYDENRYAQVDPTVLHCLQSTIPLVWSDSLFQGQARTLWEEAKAYGLQYGLSCPVHDQTGAAGMLSLARDRPLGAHAEEVTELLAIAQLLASFVHAGLSRVVVPELLKGTRPQLTRRQKECLRWAAEGKTAWEISKILSISERTAIFHLSAAVQKLGASNRSQAIARAVLWGLL
jgi:DNA-binding CsgD family transcriptional regulator